jgi:hypothetical protein
MYLYEIKYTFLVTYIFLLHFSKNLFLSSACIKNRCSIIFHGKEICIIHDTSKFKNLICQTFFKETFLNCKILWRKFRKKFLKIPSFKYKSNLYCAAICYDNYDWIGVRNLVISIKKKFIKFPSQVFENSDLAKIRVLRLHNVY